MVMSVPSHSACGKHGRTASGPTASIAISCAELLAAAAIYGRIECRLEPAAPAPARPRTHVGKSRVGLPRWRHSPRVGGGSEPKMMSGFGRGFNRSTQHLLILLD